MRPGDAYCLQRKVVGILQPGYLPWLGFFEQLARSDVFVLYDDVQFEKGSWRNRNRIKTPGGIQWLTVPILLKGKGRPLIRDVQINTKESWAEKHIRTISQHYQKTPYFTIYAEELFEILRREWHYLVDLDVALIAWLSLHLGIRTKTILSSELGIKGSGNDRLIRIIRSLSGSHFYEGAAGRNYIDLERFESAGIRVVFQDYVHPVYPQLYDDFISHLSIVDLLFNCGSQSLGILTR
jgi:hypothetical protein